MIYIPGKNIGLKYFTSIIAIVVFFLCIGVSANQADRDPNFNTGLPVGFDNIVKSIKVQSDGKVLVGGSFSSYNGITTNAITRLNADGGKDFSFTIGSGFNAAVSSVILQSDAKILVGGQFTSYDGTPTNRIVRLNSDGSRDTTFTIGSGFDNSVDVLMLQSDGKVLVGGQFTSYDGTPTNRIVRLNSDGSKDTTFTIGSGFNAAVSSLTLQADGKILVGGGFTSYDGTPTNRIVRLNSDGSKDTTFTIGSGFDNSVDVLMLQSDGKVLVGGQFTSYDGFSINRIIRLLSDGSRDTTFTIGSGFNAAVSSLTLQADGKILVGGGFTSYNGFSINRIVRLNSDGSRDTTFTIGNGFNSTVNAVAIQPDGKTLVGGSFITYNWVAINRIIRLNTDGSRDTTFNVGNGFNSMVNAVAIQSDAKILVGGQFTSYEGTTVNRILRLYPDGSRDLSFSTGSLANDNINAIAIQTDGKIIIGGNFVSYNLTSLNRIVRLLTDGSRDTSFNVGNGFNNNVNFITLQSDGKVLVGGQFTSYDGTPTNRIVRLNSDGSRDTTFIIGSGFDNSVDVLILQTDGKILVGGQFTSYDGIPTNRIVRLNSDGSKDTTFTIGSGFNAAVNAVTVQSDGKILAGGQFTSYDGFSINRIIRLLSDGSRDTSFTIGNGFNNVVRNIRIENNNKIIVGGNFTSYSGFSINYIVRLTLTGSRDTSFNVGNGFNSYVKTINIQENKKILVGGNFTSYGQGAAGFLTLLYGDTDLVILPNSIDSAIVKNEFTSKGYTQTNGYLVGSKAISLLDTDGNIPTSLSIKNDNIKLSMTADTQLKKLDNTTNYNGIISVPISKSVNSVNDETVLSAFKVGSSTESIKLNGGVATLLAPAPGKTIGSTVDIYYSEDNGVTRYPQTTSVVIDYNGQPYVEFTTNHFTDFAITIPAGSFTGTFTINSDAVSTTSQTVTLNISTTPPAAKMRFSDDGITRPAWENYSTSKVRTLPGTYGSKTVYAQFDADGDNVSDAEASDDILYSDSIGGGGGSSQGQLILEIGHGTGSCQYGTSLNLGAQVAGYSAKIFSGSFASSFRCEDKNGTDDDWVLSIQSSLLTNASNSSYTIPAMNVELQNSPAHIVNGNCAIYTGTTSRTPINSPTSILGKNHDMGAICKIQADTVTLKVTTDINQAVGIYTGMLTIDIPNFN